MKKLVIFALLLVSVSSFAQTAAWKKLSSGGVACTGKVQANFENWGWKGTDSPVLGKTMFIMRDHCNADYVGESNSIYAHAWYSVDSNTGQFTLVSRFNNGIQSSTAAAGTECATDPKARHLYAGNGYANNKLFFGWGACNVQGVKDLVQIDTASGAVTNMPMGSVMTSSATDTAMAGDLNRHLLVYAQDAGSGGNNKTWYYDTVAGTGWARLPSSCSGTGCVAVNTNFCTAPDTSCPPTARSSTMDYSRRQNVFVQFGGIVSGSVSAQTWAYYPNSTWTGGQWVRKADGPFIQARPCFTYNPDRDEFVFIGATTGSGTPVGVYTYSVVSNTWTAWSTTVSGVGSPTTPPKFYNDATCTQSSVAYDSTNHKLVMLNEYQAGGGNGDHTPEVWTLEFPPLATIAVKEKVPQGVTSTWDRTNDPVKLGIPFAKGKITSTSQLTMSGCSRWQFECTAQWEDGSCKWVKTDFLQPSLTHATEASTCAVSTVSSGGGNSTQGNIAVDNGDGTFTVTTGASTSFKVKSAGHNGIDQAIVNGTTVVASGSSLGLVLLGPDTTATPVPAPVSAPTVTWETGTSTVSSQRQYYFRVAYVGASGESPLSPATALITIPANATIHVQSPPQSTPAALGYRVWVGSSASVMYPQPTQGDGSSMGTPVTIGSDWVEGTNTHILTTHYSDDTNNFSLDGQPYGCGTCSTVYSSAYDSTSSCSLEDNGPVRATLRCEGYLKSSGGVPYLKFIDRITFVYGKTNATIEVALRNADYATTVYNREFKSFAYSVKPSFSGTKSYSIATDTTPVTGTLTASDTAYLYQAFTNCWQDSNFSSTGLVKDSIIWRTSGASTAYSQSGYEAVKNGAVLSNSGAISSYSTCLLSGWADFSSTSGIGVNVGSKLLGPYWPKSLEVNNSTGEVKIGMLPDQLLYTGPANTQMPYEQTFGTQSLYTLFIDFHSATPADPAADFSKWQWNLVGRVPVDYYNSTSALTYPMVTDTDWNNWALSLPGNAICCLGPYSGYNRTIRSWDWNTPGESGQSAIEYSTLQLFLTHGLTDRLVYSEAWNHHLNEDVFPWLDGLAGGWRAETVWPKMAMGYAQNPQQFGRRWRSNWASNVGWSHFHTYMMPSVYYLTGDEWMKETLGQPVADIFLQTAGSNSWTMGGVQRTLGARLASLANYHRYLKEQGDPNSEAATAFTIGDRILANDVLNDVQVTGVGSRSTSCPDYGVAPMSGSMCAVYPSTIPVQCGGVNSKRGIPLGPVNPCDQQYDGAVNTLVQAGIHTVGTDIVITPDSMANITVGSVLKSDPVNAGNNFTVKSITPDGLSFTADIGSFDISPSTPSPLYGIQRSSALMTETFENAIGLMGKWEYGQERKYWDNTWANYRYLMDQDYGVAQWDLQEGEGWDSGSGCGSTTPNVPGGFSYVVTTEMPNGPCPIEPEAHATVRATEWANFWTLWQYAGTSSWSSKFNITTNNFIMSSAGGPNFYFENGGYLAQAVLYAANHSQNKPTLSPVSGLTVSNLGGGNFTLHWTAPANVISYRVKYWDRTTNVLDTPLRFDIVNYTWVDDPASNDPWFSGQNAPVDPSPTVSAGSIETATVTIPNYDPLKNYTFAVRAYTGTAPLPDTSHPAFASSVLSLSGVSVANSITFNHTYSVSAGSGFGLTVSSGAVKTSSTPAGKITVCKTPQ